MLLRGKRQQQTNNNHLFYLAAFPPHPILCVHRAISELCFHANSLVALFACCSCCRVCRALIINIIICLWYCMSTRKSTFPLFLMIRLDRIYQTLQPLVFVETFLCSLSLTCCKNTPVGCGHLAWETCHSPRWVRCCLSNHIRNEIPQMDKAGQQATGNDKQPSLSKIFSVKCDANKSTGGRQRDGDVGRERGKVK